jgi:hypothetical protein
VATNIPVGTNPSLWSDLTTPKYRRDWRSLFHDNIILTLTPSTEKVILYDIIITIIIIEAVMEKTNSPFLLVVVGEKEEEPNPQYTKT